MTCKPVRIGSRSFVGPGTCMSGGTVLGEGAATMDHSYWVVAKGSKSGLYEDDVGGTQVLHGGLCRGDCNAVLGRPQTVIELLVG